MDLNKDAHKASQAAEKETQKNSINENHHSAVPIDPPPPYNEAIKIHPYQDSSYSAPLPYAPSLEPNNAISYPSNNLVPNNFPQSGVPNDGRFQQWDNNATRIVIIHRSQMNDRFAAAKSSWETELLWNIILNDLLIHGYHFTVFDLMQYWGFLFQMYSNILSGIASGGHYTNWEHFSTMHQAFGSDSGSTLLDATPMSGSGLTELRYNTTAPLAMSSPVELNLMENLTLPNPNVPHGTGVLPAEPLLNPLSTSTSTAQLSSSEGVPSLPQNYDNPILQSEILSKSSKLVTESSSDPLPTSATTLLPASATLPNTTVIPATLNIMPTEASQVSNTPDLLPTLPAAPSVPLAGDLPGAVPLLDPQVSASVVNESSIQQSLNMLQLNDSANLPSNVWMKPDAIFSEPLVRPAYQMTLTDQAVAGAGEYAANSGPIEDLLKCTPPVGLSAITTQPGVMSATNVLEDGGGFITSQPTADNIPTVDSYDNDYGCCDNCCDSCCGEDFCCDDCYCEGGDCDFGDC